MNLENYQAQRYSDLRSAVLSSAGGYRVVDRRGRIREIPLKHRRRADQALHEALKRLGQHGLAPARAGEGTPLRNQFIQNIVNGICGMLLAILAPYILVWIQNLLNGLLDNVRQMSQVCQGDSDLQGQLLQWADQAQTYHSKNYGSAPTPVKSWWSWRPWHPWWHHHHHDDWHHHDDHHHDHGGDHGHGPHHHWLWWIPLTTALAFSSAGCHLEPIDNGGGYGPTPPYHHSGMEAAAHEAGVNMSRLHAAVIREAGSRASDFNSWQEAEEWITNELKEHEREPFEPVYIELRRQFPGGEWDADRFRRLSREWSDGYRSVR